MDNRKILALLAAMTLTVSAASCGNDIDTIEVSSDTSASDEAADISADTADTTKSAKTTSATTSKKSDSKTTASTSGGKAASSTTKSASAEASGSSDSSNTSSDSSSGGSSSDSSSSGESSGNSSGDSSSGGSTSNGSSSGGSSGGSSSGSSSGGSSSGGSAENNDQEETESYDAEIKFSGSPTISGSNAKANGSVVTITAGGTYHITGSSSDGQIRVDTATEEKVKIVLDGVDLTCSSGPALFINEAKKCTVELAEGSKNKLKDTNKDKVNDGVIFSNDTLRIKGGGSLEITAGNAHGIASDDDVIIEGGTYVINSVKSGIFAHDDITVNGGELTVYGGTNGIKSKGTVNIAGGTMYVSGGTKEEKSSIYAGTALNYTKGYVFAAGNKVTAPDEKTISTPYVVVSFENSMSAGSELTFYINGSEKGKLTPHNDFRCAIMLAPDIPNSGTFNIGVDGKKSKDFKISATKNVFTVD